MQEVEGLLGGTQCTAMCTLVQLQHVQESSWGKGGAADTICCCLPSAMPALQQTGRLPLPLPLPLRLPLPINAQTPVHLHVAPTLAMSSATRRPLRYLRVAVSAAGTANVALALHGCHPPVYYRKGVTLQAVR